MTALPLQWSIDTGKISRAATAAFSFEASSAELDALKNYAAIEDLTSFQSEVQVRGLSGGRYRLTGVLRASLVQSSVVDLEAVPAQIEESLSVEYWPVEALSDQDGAVAPFAADPPEALVRGHIPIGELLCELFLVAIDPYPRNDGDSFDWDPPQPEPQTSPFAELGRFRPSLCEKSSFPRK